MHDEQRRTSRETGKIGEVIPIAGVIAGVDTEMKTEEAIGEVASHQLERNGSEQNQIREMIAVLRRKPQRASVLRETRLEIPGTQTKTGVLGLGHQRQQRQRVHKEKLRLGQDLSQRLFSMSKVASAT